MSDQNKDNLENFFRERAQNHNIEFNESDWLKLESKLDAEMPNAFSLLSFLKRFGIIALLLLMLPATWYSYQYYSNREESTTLSNLNTQDQGDDKISQTKALNTEQSTPTNKAKESSQTTNNGSLKLIPDQTKESGHQTRQKFDLENEKKSQKTQNSKNVIQTKEIGYAVLEDGAKSNSKMDLMLHFLSPLPPESLIENPKYTDYLKQESVHKISPTITKKTSFNIGIGYSPDFSTVGIGNFVSPGSRWTIIGEYAFSKRFQLISGIVWVNNKYEAYGEDYHAPSRYWKKGIVADEAYGECKMIDIPLNLRYNILIKGKNQAFVSAGASTYFILKEDYYFHYYQEDPELPDHWGTDKMTVYPFGIINVSFGYQYQFSRKSAIQIEPYIKIPTTGIGWGEVDLHTMGVYFMYKYRISR